MVSASQLQDVGDRMEPDEGTHCVSCRCLGGVGQRLQPSLESMSKVTFEVLGTLEANGNQPSPGSTVSIPV